jgi:hypothetical protein
LLYHRELRALVAVELKIDQFKPQYAGKMNFYLSLLNGRIRKPHENPGIGIIICKNDGGLFSKQGHGSVLGKFGYI